MDEGAIYVDELIEHRRSRLSPAGRELLAKIEGAERSADGDLMSATAAIADRIFELPQSDRDEMLAIFDAKIQGHEARLREAELWEAAARRELDRRRGKGGVV